MHLYIDVSFLKSLCLTLKITLKILKYELKNMNIILADLQLSDLKKLNKISIIKGIIYYFAKAIEKECDGMQFISPI